MEKETTRTCLNGVNKGTIKLFGVNITTTTCDDPINYQPEEVITPLRKSLSLGNIESLLDDIHQSNGDGDLITAVEDTGYHSDGQIHSRKVKVDLDKKKGKGDWRGISKNFVKTRTPTQVASHAQKYFIRLNANDKRKRRNSLFDITLEEDQKGNEKNFHVIMRAEASTLSSSKIQPKQAITGMQEPVQGQTQTEISNRFQNLSMQYRMPMYQTMPPYYNFPTPMYHPMYYAANHGPIRFVHPSGIPIPKYIPIGMPQIQSHEASTMTKKDGFELDIGLRTSQATGSTDLTGHDFIHVK
ncbi:unnamed protein product [Cochlearia groenlandica]